MTPTTSPGRRGPSASYVNEPTLDWLQRGRLIESWIAELVEADDVNEPRTTLYRRPSRLRLPAESPRCHAVAAAPRSEADERTNVTLELPDLTEDARSESDPAIAIRTEVWRRGPLPSVSAVDTRRVTLSPAFLDALKRVGPKKRRSPIPYVLGLAVAAFATVLAADVSTRDFVIEKAQVAVAHVF